jgi:LacI family transcriptional regulator
MELMEALEKMCIHVPADISIIGFDDLQGQGADKAKLTTKRQNVPKKASVAATMLFEQIATKERVPENVCLAVELVERASVAKK